jgi:FKBP-type peptidyl-prolyl cis-trans isomerase SlyD
MKISDEKIVSLIYDLTVDEGDDKELMERATPEQPLTFMFGMGMMLDTFEKNIRDLKVGDKFSFSLTPEEAYGEYDEEKVVELPKEIFYVDGRLDEEKIAEGETLQMMDSQGNRLMGSILEVKADIIIMDFNHPLAGETLHFDGEVIDVHEASPEEIAALTHEDSCDCDGCGSADNENGCSGCH